MSAQKIRQLSFNIIIVYFVILIAGSWVSYSVWQSGRSINLVSQTLTQTQVPALNQISDLRHWVNEYERLLYELYATVDRSSVSQQLSTVEINVYRNIHGLQMVYKDNESLVQVKRLFTQMQVHAKLLDKVLPPEPYDWDQARNELVIISALGRDIFPHLNNLIISINRQLEASKLQTHMQLKHMSGWVIAFSILILLIAVLVGIYIRKANHQAKEKQRLSLFIEKNPNPVACLSFSGKVEFKNQAWQQNFVNYEKESLTQKAFEKIQKLQKSDDDFFKFTFQSELQVFDLSIQKISQLNQFMLYVEDVSERESARKELEFLAYYDPLTELPNFKSMESTISQLILESSGEPVYLISFGVKRLQLITTTHGHSVTDALIQALASRLKQVTEVLGEKLSVCQLYRFTGAKFELLLAKPKDNENFASIVLLLESQIRAVKNSPLDTSFGIFYIDIQAGCAIFPEHAQTTSMLIKNASAALNDAQKHRLSGITLFDHELAVREKNWLRVENDLRQSRYSSEFFLMYQPKVRLSDHQLIGMEALVRWQHPQKGMVSPVDFIPIAEESGAILSLGEWILDAAIAQTCQWVSEGHAHLQVAVNVSPSQLLSAKFAENVIACLDTYQLAPQHLEIEVTESVMVEDITECISVLRKLREHGISIAIDDFGTGYSSLAYLSRLPLSKLKIDRSFVTRIELNNNNYAIVNAIVALSKSLGLTLIAEGIETKEELAVLCDLGCEQGQGYLFDKPLVTSEFQRIYLTS